MMFDLITVLTRSRALRIATEARSGDPDNTDAEERARIALVELASGMDVQVHPERPARWSDCAALSARLEAAAHALAETRDGTFDQIGAVSTLTLHFGAVASRMGYDVEANAPRTHDDVAMAAVENRQEVRDAAE